MIKVTNSGAEYTFDLSGDIGQSWFSDGWTLERFKNELKGVDASVVNINVKSMGGDVFEAFAIYDDIKNMPARVKVNIVGSSASAATIIAAAADEVTISENSRYLVHNAQTFVEGNKEKVAEVYEMLKSIDEQILNIYIKRTGKSKEALAELMKGERWLTAEEALDWGFVDKITKSLKIKNQMTEEEKAEMEQLKADKEALLQKVAELEAQLAEIDAKEMEEEVEAAVQAGKIKADAKDTFLAIGKLNRETMTNALTAIEAQPARLADIVDPATPVKGKTKEEIWKAYKSGEITYDEVTKQFAKLK